MPKVAFHISGIQKSNLVERIQNGERIVVNPNEHLVDAYFLRGEMGIETDPITNESKTVFKATERWKEVSVLFVPGGSTDQSINENLYDLLLTYINNDDEVIAECVY